MSTAPTSTNLNATTAGIVERADTQQRVIPESRRADGSVRKERKIKPGFTPVEDVVRYRPARAREAEEARKRGHLNGTAPASTTLGASPSAEAAPPPRTSTFGTPDADGKMWRSTTTGTGPSFQRLETSTPPRGRFAPLEPTRKKSEGLFPATAPLAKSEAPSPHKQPWQGSRLRKPLPPKQNLAEAAAVPDAWDRDESTQRPKPDRVLQKEPSPGRTDASADDLVAELDSLRINSDKDATDK